MSIRIKLSYLQPHINRAKVVEVNGSTVGECLEHLRDKLPKAEILDKDGRLFAGLEVQVNGEITYPEGLAKPVKDGDDINIVLSMFVGG